MRGGGGRRDGREESGERRREREGSARQVNQKKIRSEEALPVNVCGRPECLVSLFKHIIGENTQQSEVSEHLKEKEKESAKV